MLSNAGASLVALRRGLRSFGITSPTTIRYSDPSANARDLGDTEHGDDVRDDAWA